MDIAAYTSNGDRNIGAMFWFDTGNQYSALTGQTMVVTIIGKAKFWEDETYILRVTDISRGIDYMLCQDSDYLTPFGIYKTILGTKRADYFSFDAEIIRDTFTYLDDIYLMNQVKIRELPSLTQLAANFGELW